jgi:hypothetical protein
VRINLPRGMAVLVIRSVREAGPAEACPNWVIKDTDKGGAVLDWSPVTAEERWPEAKGEQGATRMRALWDALSWPRRQKEAPATSSITLNSSQVNGRRCIQRAS